MLIGKNDAETIKNVQKFILDNFSFEIVEGAEGWAYFGMSGATVYSDDAPIYQCIKGLVKNKS